LPQWLDWCLIDTLIMRLTSIGNAISGIAFSKSQN
jgi:hypothetical protein